nr:uncharacterized protein LOC124818778 [Hydra vulgaris]
MKSTLIKSLFGQVMDTSSNQYISTRVGTSYKFVNDNVIIWDPKELNKWSKISIDDFWKECFQYTTDLLSFCLFCVGTGANADTSLIKYMFDKYVFKNNIPLFWVITKADQADISQTNAFVNEGVKLLCDVIKVIQPTIAWKTVKSFIFRINSIKSCINIPNQPETKIKKFEIKTLNNIFAEYIPMSLQQNLMQLLCIILEVGLGLLLLFL